MNPRVVAIPGVGNVEFPGEMSDEQVAAAIKSNYPNLGQPPNAKTTLERMKSGLSFKEAMDPYIGFAKGLGQTAATTASLVNKIPYVGETLAPSQGVQAMQQAVQPTNTAQQIGKLAEGAGEMAIPVGGGGAKAAESTLSTKGAQQMFQSVMEHAGSVPVSLDNASEGALKLMDWQKKTQLGPTINKFLNRITNPKLGPMTYQEGRDFYQLLGQLSSDESSRLAPAVRRDLVQMVVGLKQDIGNAASVVGKGEEYAQAMADYARVMKNQAAAKFVGKTAAGATLGAGATAAAKAFWDWLP